VDFSVTNTGEVAGKEIVQLYIGCPGSLVDRPVRELRAFDKVHIDPGVTQTISLEISTRNLAYYDVGLGRWKVEKGSYVVEVGPSSRDLPLRSVFTIE